ncbi:MAG: hypothetical protein J0L83_14540 [Chitinophagales bacterium]|nr:hypothetical protein [Chitinophagales bacterium]
MLKLSKDGSNVTLEFTLSIGYVIPFRVCNHTPMNAQLLKDAMNQTLHSRIERIRKEAYEQGWKDAKSRKVAKKTTFSTDINAGFWGY